jgi:hypothetical protein
MLLSVTHFLRRRWLAGWFLRTPLVQLLCPGARPVDACM